ncbi:MAG: cysteine protease StiP family protein [Candidatus Competibacteraceae bacterium]|nr:cysteine protease StiP family protein [Candidatus Competibacteraceae bacterium]
MNPPFNAPISGSYAPEDCLFLLKPIEPPHVTVAEKEHLIQSGQRHYSEMITHEGPVSPVYSDLFLHLTNRYKARLAQDVLNLAENIRRSRPEPVTLVSLARAGTPIGALVQRALTRLSVKSKHYSISIIRDRGIDERALAYILHQAQRPAEGVVFIDGWTAKGVITRELKQSIAAWNAEQSPQLNDSLYVIADLGGVADVAATHDDYAIPSGILGATVSGLVSRSILNEQILPGDFHGCVVYEHLLAHDRSRWFLDTVDALMADFSPQPLTVLDKAARRAQIHDYLAKIQREYGIAEVNYIKPGVLEASRVMLRRVPGLLLLRDQDNQDVTHLQLLAEEKGVVIRYDPEMPFNATALIRILNSGAARPQ